MAQFRGIIQGSRGEASRLGGKSSGLRAVCNGWHKGVTVIARHKDGKDIFNIYETGGSNGAESENLIAIIEEA